MLQQQQTISFSDYSSLYDLIIPKDNLLRQINELVDFSFVCQELQDKYCHDNGRTAESPIRMFKYLLLKVIYNVSDVDVVERARYDMSFKYFLGLTHERLTWLIKFIDQIPSASHEGYRIIGFTHQKDRFYCYLSRGSQIQNYYRWCNPYAFTFQSY